MKNNSIEMMEIWGNVVNKSRKNSATDTVEIRKCFISENTIIEKKINNPFNSQQFKDIGEKEREIEVSVWDFGGQEHFFEGYFSFSLIIIIFIF